MKFIISVIVGAGLGAISTLLHLSLFPFGLTVALIGTLIGIWAIGRQWLLRRYKFIASIAWLLVVVRGATLGVGGELLVQGDLAGSLLILVGTLTLIVSVLLPN